MKGVTQFKKLGEQRTMMSGEQQLQEPIMSLVIGSALLYLPSTVRTGMYTFWSSPNPYAYVTDENSN